MPDLRLMIESEVHRVVRDHTQAIIDSFEKAGVRVREDMPLLVQIKAGAGTASTLLEQYQPELAARLTAREREHFVESFYTLEFQHKAHRQSVLTRLKDLERDLQNKTLGLVVEVKFDENQQVKLEFRMPDGRTLGQYSAKDLSEQTIRGQILKQVQDQKTQLAITPSSAPRTLTAKERAFPKDLAARAEAIRNAPEHPLSRAPSPPADLRFAVHDPERVAAINRKNAELDQQKEREAELKREQEKRAREAAEADAGYSLRPRGFRI